jgi:hypothetical protein
MGTDRLQMADGTLERSGHVHKRLRLPSGVWLFNFEHKTSQNDDLALNTV